MFKKIILLLILMFQITLVGMGRTLISNFDSWQEWSSTTSENTKVRIETDRGVRGQSLQFTYKFAKPDDWFRITKDVNIDFDTNFSMTFFVKGTGANNHLKIILVLDSGEEYIHQIFNYKPTSIWNHVIMTKNEWILESPKKSSKKPRKIQQVKIELSCLSGDDGTIQIDELDYTVSDDPAPTVIVNESSKLNDKSKGQYAADNDLNTHWTGTAEKKEWLKIDIGEFAEIYALTIYWGKPNIPDFDVEISSDNKKWERVNTKEYNRKKISNIFIPRKPGRYIRINNIQLDKNNVNSIREIVVKPHEINNAIVNSNPISEKEQIYWQDLDDDDFYLSLEQSAFDYFWYESNPDGLIPYSLKSPKIFNPVYAGYHLMMICIGTERGWIHRVEGGKEVVKVLNSLLKLTDKDGFFYNSYDLLTQKPLDKNIDMSNTGLYMIGILFCAEYFNLRTSIEKQIQKKSKVLFNRIDWNILFTTKDYFVYKDIKNEKKLLTLLLGFGSEKLTDPTEKFEILKGIVNTTDTAVTRQKLVKTEILHLFFKMEDLDDRNEDILENIYDNRDDMRYGKYGILNDNGDYNSEILGQRAIMCINNDREFVWKTISKNKIIKRGLKYMDFKMFFDK